MENIKNYDSYNNEMRKSLEDKLFFIDKIDVNCIVDYGCADGSLLKFIREKDEKVKLHGIDMSSEMIKRAKEKVPTANFTVSNVPYIDNTFCYEESALNLSSVIHEVYSYSSKDEIETFWDKVNNSGYKYIIIRDMICDITTDEKSDTNKVSMIKSNDTYKDKLLEFENIWGTIDNKRNLLHFLLKYRYSYNWDREVRENYIPLSFNELINKISKQYKLVSKTEFMLPFIHDTIIKDFNIDVSEYTHAKLIFKLK